MKILLQSYFLFLLLAEFFLPLPRVAAQDDVLPLAADAETYSRVILDRKTPEETRLQAVEAVGRNRIAACIPALISELDRIYVHHPGLVPLRQSLPCIGALIDIGEPSVEPVVAALKREPAYDMRNMFRNVLKNIAGVERANRLLEGSGFTMEIEQGPPPGESPPETPPRTEVTAQPASPLEASKFSASPPPQPSPGESSPRWPWALGMAVVTAVALWAAKRRA